MHRKEKVEKFLRYTFNASEIQGFHEDISQAIDRQLTAEDEKASAMAGFKDRIETEKSLIAITNRKVRNGYEMRNIPCRVEYNTPNTTFKRITRIDTGELVEEVQMDAAEMQEEIDFEKARAVEAETARDAISDTHPELWASVEQSQASVDAFFKSTASSGEELMGWGCGSWIIAAHSAEEALKFADLRSLPIESRTFTLLDPDAVFLYGNQEVYGDESRSIRKAITHLISLGETFPVVLDGSSEARAKKKRGRWVPVVG